MVNGFNADKIAQAAMGDKSFENAYTLAKDAKLKKALQLQGQDNDMTKMGQEHANKQSLLKAELEKAKALKQMDIDSDQTYKMGMLDVARQNAGTNERYRNDQAVNMEDQRKAEKLRLLFGGGAGGVGGIGSDGKPLASEAQKASNLVDAARSSLNNTEKLAQEHPKTAALEAMLPNIIANPLASLFGGKFKEVNDSRGMTREAIQNVKTGAAATGNQQSSFQNWSGPGALDIINGKASDGSGQLRDDLNTMQTGLLKQSRVISPEMLEAAEMQDDPMAQQAVQMQQQAAQQKTQQKLQTFAPADRAAYEWLQANPQAPEAAGIRTKLQRRYGAGI